MFLQYFRPSLSYQLSLRSLFHLFLSGHSAILSAFIKLPFVIKIFVLSIFSDHSAILPTFIKLPFVIKIFVLSIFEWRFYTGFTVNEAVCGILIPVTYWSSQGLDEPVHPQCLTRAFTANIFK